MLMSINQDRSLPYRWLLTCGSRSMRKNCAERSNCFYVLHESEITETLNLYAIPV